MTFSELNFTHFRNQNVEILIFHRFVYKICWVEGRLGKVRGKITDKCVEN